MAPPISTDEYAVTVTPGRAGGVYRVGEAARFSVQASRFFWPVAGRRIKVTLEKNGVTEVSSLARELDGRGVVVEGSLDEPGFLRCEATLEFDDGQAVTGAAGVAFDPLSIRPSLPAPEDFDEFWEKKTKALAAVPLNAARSPSPLEARDVEFFDVRADSLGESPVRGYLARPAGAGAGSLPALLLPHGAGVKGARVREAASGGQLGFLTLDFNAHGILNGQPDSYYKDLQSGPLAQYWRQGWEDRETCYFLGMFLRAMRALDLLCAQPEWDGKNLMLLGGSQGGAQVLAVAGLDDRVSALAAVVPGACDHTGCVVGRRNGWPRLVELDDAGAARDPRMLEAARYFDAVNFAARIKAPAILAANFVDGAAAAEGIYAAYNSLRSEEKRIINSPTLGHSIAGGWDASVRFLLDHVV